jgi:F-type H+-transporting ATPase subunit epsilon
MSSVIRIEVVTPDRQVVQKEVECAFLPTQEGDIGVFSGHMPLVTALRSGEVRLVNGQEEDRLSIAEGIGMIEPKMIRVFTSQASEIRG